MEPAERFFALFAGYEERHGVYDITGENARGKVQGNARTVDGPATVELWRKHLEGSYHLGVIPLRRDDSVFWGCIDIDKIGIDHAQLEQLCEPLPVVVARSKSGGAHVYLFLAQPLPASIVRSKLVHWAAYLGHARAEVFPKQTGREGPGDVGNWLNMPYQNSDMTLRYAFREGQRLTMLEFLDFAEQRRATLDMLDRVRVSVGKQRKESGETPRQHKTPPPLKGNYFLDGPPCLQVLTAEPLQEGMRNSVLFNIAVYMRKKFPEDWQEKTRFANTRLLEPPLSEKEIATILKSVGRKSYAYTCKQAPLEGVCNRPTCLGREHGVGTTEQDNAGGVEITHVKKVITGDEVYWELTINDHPVRLRTKELMSQEKFCEVCMERASFVWHRLPLPRWQAILQRWLDNADTEVAPIEASRIGQFRGLVYQFCNGNVQANVINEIVLGKPFRDTESGRTLFTPLALLQYLSHHRFMFMDAKDVWALLVQSGGQSKEVQIAGRATAAWSVPSNEGREFKDALPVPDYDGRHF